MMYWINKLFNAESWKELEQIAEIMKLRPVSYDKSVQVMLEVKSTHVETKTSITKLPYETGTINEAKSGYES